MLPPCHLGDVDATELALASQPPPPEPGLGKRDALGLLLLCIDGCLLGDPEPADCLTVTIGEEADNGPALSSFSRAGFSVTVAFGLCGILKLLLKRPPPSPRPTRLRALASGGVCSDWCLLLLLLLSGVDEGLVIVLEAVEADLEPSLDGALAAAKEGSYFGGMLLSVEDDSSMLSRDDREVAGEGVRY